MPSVYIKTVEGGEVTSLGDNDGVEIDTGATSVWIKIVNLAKQIFNRLTGLTADTAPAISADYLLEYDTSAGESKKLLIADLLTLIGYIPGGRLTLTSGTPVTTADVTAATIIYYTPYIHNRILLWDGTRWVSTSFSEVSLALGTMTSGLPYDVFGYLSSGALTLEKLAWTSGTARATAVTLQDGRHCKSGDKTRLYLGTFYTTSTTTTEDSGGGVTTQVGGRRFLWNMYNRVIRPMAVIDTTDTWSYTTDTTRQANGAAGNQVEFVLGISEDAVEALVVSSVQLASNTTRGAKSGPGLDTTTAFTGVVSQAFNASASNINISLLGELQSIPVVGYHYISWNERGAIVGTSTFAGDAGATGTQTGLTATVKG